MERDLVFTEDDFCYSREERARGCCIEILSCRFSLFTRRERWRKRVLRTEEELIDREDRSKALYSA